MRTFLRASALVGVAALVTVLCSPLQVRTAETRTPLVRADHFDAAEDRTSECVSGPPPWTHVALWIAPDMPETTLTSLGCEHTARLEFLHSGRGSN